MQKQLTKQEQEEFNKIKDSRLNAAQEGALNSCLQYYLTYRAKADKAHQLNIPLAFKWAFFMAEKSQFTTNLKGQKVRGISFSLNKLLKDYKLEDAMFMLKQMIKVNTSIDNDTRIYLSNIVKQISFLMTFYNKFERTFGQKFQLKQKINDGGSYIKIFTHYAWLFFIIFKNQVLKRSCDVTPNTYMMAHIISTMLILAWDYIKPEGLMKGDKRLNENASIKDVRRIIKQKVLQNFCIKEIGDYGKVANAFEQHFNAMIQKNMFRMNQEKWDFLSPEHINVNYKKLDKYFQQSLNIQDIDERIFLKQRCLNLTPSKFTPFARQGYANKYHKPALGNKLGGQKATKEQTYNSHRILNYDAIEKQIETRNIPIQQIRLPKNIIQSPSMVKVPLIVTPISAGMGMYNYINEKKKLFHTNFPQRSFDRYVFPLMYQVFDHHRCENDNINKQTKQQMIMALCKIYSQEYFALNTAEVQSHQLMKAFLGLSIELVFFVSNITLTFQTIQEILHIQPFQMWKVIDFFLKSDKAIPSPIKIHFFDLETQYISSKIWQNMEMVKKLSDYGNKYIKEMSESQINNMDKLLKRALHQISLQITILTKQLSIDEVVGQKIFDLMKQIIVNCPQTLYRRHFDQLIICAIFAYSKAFGLNIKFIELKQKYVELYESLKSLAEETLMSIYISDHEQPKDIIAFYNKVFLSNPKIKQFIVSTLDPNSTNMSAKNNAKKNTLLMSPMKAIIPQSFTFKPAKPSYGNNGAQKTKNGFTPQTQLLYAYTQSPILKYEVSALKGPLKSKKVINYEQQQQKFRNNRSQQQDVNVAVVVPLMKPTTSDNNIHQINNYTSATNTNNYQSSTNDYINKKFGRKATTPTNTQQIQHTHSHTQSQQIQIPLQNTAKQNQNPPLSSNSHRALFDTALEKGQDNKYKNKNYQFGAYKRQ